MSIYAWKNGLEESNYNQAKMNPMISAQPSSLIFDGTSAGSEPGSNVSEVNLSTYHVHWSCDLKNGATSIGRIEIDVKKYGSGADLTLEIHSSPLAPPTSLLKKITFPAKIFTDGIISLPVDLNGLSSNQIVYVILRKNGDSTNHLRVRGSSTAATVWAFKTSSDGNTWSSLNQSMRLNIYTNAPGTYQLRHGIYGENAKSIVEYNGDGTIKHIWRWLPAADGTFVICDKLVPIYDANGVATRWEVQ